MRSDYHIAHGALRQQALRERAVFLGAVHDPASQNATLARIIARNAETEFGREHDFGRCHAPHDFRRRVPVREYDGFAPYIARIAAGASRVLTRERVRALVPTSGTTSGPKLVPHTDALRSEFRRGILPWLGDLYANHPAVGDGRWYWSITAPAEPPASSAVPIGQGDDEDYFTPRQQRCLARILGVSPELARLRDMETWRYATLLSLARCHDLAFISVWSPTFLSALLSALKNLGDSLCRDLHDGTFSPPVATPEGQQQRFGRRANPAAARRLASALSSGALAQTLWPRLAVVSSWANASSASYAAHLAQSVPHAKLQGKGLLSTEGVVTLPIEGVGCVLAVTSHYCEFLDEGAGAVVPAAGVRVGSQYRVVITTGGGLYRYDTGDVVGVDGRLGRAPVLTFLGRGMRVSDRCGEKLDERLVSRAIGRAAEHVGVVPSFAMLAPSTRGLSYTLFLGCDSRPRATALSHLKAALELELSANPHYSLCRRLGQLDGLRVHIVDASRAHEAYQQRLRGLGQRLGTIKPPALDPRNGWEHAFGAAMEESR